MSKTTIAQDEDRRKQLPEEARRHGLAQVANRTNPPWRRRPTVVARRPVVVALIGVALMGLSARILALNPAPDEIAQVSADAVLADVKPAEVATAELVYAPGHSSGWHVHPGVHAVVVLSGTLTVYDEACRRHDYRPGQTYLGGREPHLASNTGAEAVGLAIIYVSDPSAHVPGNPVAPPKGCHAA